MLKTRGDKFQNIFSLNCNSFGEFRDTFAMNVEYYVASCHNHLVQDDSNTKPLQKFAKWLWHRFLSFLKKKMKENKSCFDVQCSSF